MSRFAASLGIAFTIMVAGACSAQNLPEAGAERTLDVATWNIEHFGNDGVSPEDEQQIANAAFVIRESQIDLWAIQEIEDEGDFHRLIEAVGNDWAGIVDERSTNLRVGFLYNEKVIRVRNITNILAEFSSVFGGRPPLQMEVEATLPDTTVVMTFITLHMKAFDNAASYEQRASASRHLKNLIDYSTLDSRPVVILGDFNDELTASITAGRPSPYANFVSDTTDFFSATLGLDIAGSNTFCFTARCASGSTIDHIIITDELFAASGKRTARTYDDVFDEVPFYLSSTSDHIPVYTSFHFGQSTRSERPPDFAFTSEGPFPNPVVAKAALEVEIERSGFLSVALFDILGREIRMLADEYVERGMHTVHFDASDLTQGTYFLHIRSGTRAVVNPFIVLR